MHWTLTTTELRHSSVLGDPLRWSLGDVFSHVAGARHPQGTEPSSPSSGCQTTWIANAIRGHKSESKNVIFISFFWFLDFSKFSKKTFCLEEIDQIPPSSPFGGWRKHDENISKTYQKMMDFDKFWPYFWASLLRSLMGLPNLNL